MYDDFIGLTRFSNELQQATRGGFKQPKLHV